MPRALNLWGTDNPLQLAIGSGYDYTSAPGLAGPGTFAASFAALTGLLTEGGRTTAYSQQRDFVWTLGFKLDVVPLGETGRPSSLLSGMPLNGD